MIAPRFKKHNICGIVKSAAAGVAALFAVSVCNAEKTELAESLFAEKSWKFCLRECRYILAETPSNTQARLLFDISNLRLGRHTKRSINSLRQLSSNKQLARRQQAIAAHECGEALRTEGDEQAAFDFLTNSFYRATSKTLALKNARSIKSILDNKSDQQEKMSALRMQIERVLSGEDKRRHGPVALSDLTIATKAGELIVSFYRTAIAPALGQRCSLYPSCSEYFLRACRKHGLLGFPIQADRFVREPGVTSRKQKPVVRGKVIKYADPVSDHDFWLRSNKSEETP